MRLKKCYTLPRERFTEGSCQYGSIQSLHSARRTFYSRFLSVRQHPIITLCQENDSLMCAFNWKASDHHTLLREWFNGDLLLFWKYRIFKVWLRFCFENVPISMFWKIQTIWPILMTRNYSRCHTGPAPRIPIRIEDWDSSLAQQFQCKRPTALAQ